MIFLDTDTHYFVATSRREMIAALLAHLPDEHDDEQLARLAAACLGCQPLDVMIIHPQPPVPPVSIKGN